MLIAEINQAQIEYEEAGAGEPVVFIHGALIADTFRPLADELAAMGRYRLVLYNRRGYCGSSDLSEVVDIPLQVEDCRALLGHLSLSSAHIVGHSYGGAVALQLALESPEVVRSLALLEPALMIGESAGWYRRALIGATERYREANAPVVVDEFLRARWADYRTALDDTLPGAFDQAVTDAETTFEYELPGLLEWQFGEREARQIHQPVLSVLGGESEILWPRLGEAYRWTLDRIPNAEGFIVLGTTHFLQVQSPRVVAEALSTFWTGLTLPGS